MKTKKSKKGDIIEISKIIILTFFLFSPTLILILGIHFLPQYFEPKKHITGNIINNDKELYLNDLENIQQNNKKNITQKDNKNNKIINNSKKT